MEMSLGNFISSLPPLSTLYFFLVSIIFLARTHWRRWDMSIARIWKEWMSIHQLALSRLFLSTFCWGRGEGGGSMLLLLFGEFLPNFLSIFFCSPRPPQRIPSSISFEYQFKCGHSTVSWHKCKTKPTREFHWCNQACHDTASAPWCDPLEQGFASSCSLYPFSLSSFTSLLSPFVDAPSSFRSPWGPGSEEGERRGRDLLTSGDTPFCWDDFLGVGHLCGM